MNTIFLAIACFLFGYAFRGLSTINRQLRDFQQGYEAGLAEAMEIEINVRDDAEVSLAHREDCGFGGER